ncbi:hypothetical protein JL101_025585 [Skermanella rosea]|uniref:hypothetical protein n=1 Tax=Skermanella rosea TaxID=1817965 RepID=UPI0019338D6A|nr:hypothetical protein [Skermanella rosea]UEM03300.1 hypothetical protein JL101_025585 [Skermanella rosea]
MIGPEVIERHACGKALETLDRVLAEKPEQYHEEVVGVLRCLVAMRDHLIQERRREGPSPELDGHLDHVNAVVSVMTSGSFPVVGLSHDRLKHARDLMAGIIDTARRG